MQAYKVTGTGLVFTGHAAVAGVNLVAGAGAAASVVLNDSLDGSGADKGGVKALTGTSQDSELYCSSFTTGVYATLSGANAVAYVYVE